MQKASYTVLYEYLAAMHTSWFALSRALVIYTESGIHELSYNSETYEVPHVVEYVKPL